MSDGVLYGEVHDFDYPDAQDDVQSNFDDESPDGVCLECAAAAVAVGALVVLAAVAAVVLLPEIVAAAAVVGPEALAAGEVAAEAEAVGAAGEAAVAGEEAVGAGEAATEAAPKGPIGHIDPAEIAGKTPEEIHDKALDLGLEPKGPDPMNGRGSYVDPETGTQRILSHPGGRAAPMPM